MIIESGQIVAIETDALWVETYQKSTCGKCVAQSGCGQSLLSKYGTSATKIKVLLRERDRADFLVGQTVKIGIEESAFISGVFYLYWLPLVFMLVSLLFAKFIHLSDLQSALLVILALVIGAFCSRLYTRTAKNSLSLEPVLID